MNKKTTLLFAVILILTSLPALALETNWQDYSYTVSKVLDGDTIRLSDGNIKFTLRIATMDAPEKAQQFGKLSKYKLQSFVLDKKVKIKPVGRGLGKYGRVIAILYVDGVDIGLKMIESGLATYYRPKCRDFNQDKKFYNYDPRPYVDAENKAREGKINMWSVKNVLPCEYRKNIMKKRSKK